MTIDAQTLQPSQTTGTITGTRRWHLGRRRRRRRRTAVNLNNYGFINALGTATGQVSDGVTWVAGRSSTTKTASIFSTQRGINIGDSDGGDAFAAATITNFGRIEVQARRVDHHRRHLRRHRHQPGRRLLAASSLAAGTTQSTSSPARATPWSDRRRRRYGRRDQSLGYGFGKSDVGLQHRAPRSLEEATGRSPTTRPTPRG